MDSKHAAWLLEWIEAGDLARGYCVILRCNWCGKSNGDMQREFGVAHMYEAPGGLSICGECRRLQRSPDGAR